MTQLSSETDITRDATMQAIRDLQHAFEGAAEETGLEEESDVVAMAREARAERKGSLDERHVPAETGEAMDEADALEVEPGHVTCHSSESLFSALGV